ncbi:MAG: hypothetical protein VXW22_10515 [Pseudomonadota bacterium]|nr:hypothetical protein [Pseudomonadota bacterium]
MYIIYRLLVLAFMLSVAACGGGGGSAPAPFVPPVPVGNQPPVVSVVVSDTTPNEGQSFTFDARASSDPNGDPLTFMWTQTGGTTFEITDAKSPLQTFAIPELSESSDVTFEVEVSDGELASTGTFTVTLTNIDQFPKFDAGFSEVQTLALNGTIRDFFPMGAREITGVSIAGESRDVWFAAVSDGPAGPIRLEEFFFNSTGDIQQNPESPTLPEYAADAKFVKAATVASWIVLEEVEGRVIGLLNNFLDDGIVYEEAFIANVEQPCWFAPRVDIGEDLTDAFVAQRGVGISHLGFDLFPYPFVYYPSLSVSAPLKEDVSYCAGVVAQRVLDPSSGTPDPDGALPFEYPYIALDTDTQNLVLFERFSQARVQEVPLATASNEPLEIIAVETIDDTALIVILSDGEHEGTHRLVIVGLDQGRRITQVTRSWEVGVPSDVLVGDLNGDYRSATEITVISSTSPEAIVFSLSDERVPVVTSQGITVYPPGPLLPVTGPSFLEIGFGAQAGFADDRSLNSDGLTGLFLIYPDEGVIRFSGHRCDPVQDAEPDRCL